jgi:putative cell wall binding repeat 2
MKMNLKFGKLMGGLLIFCVVLLCFFGSGTAYAEEKLDAVFFLSVENDGRKEPLLSDISFILTDEEGNETEHKSSMGMLNIELIYQKKYTLSLQENQDYTMSKLKLWNNGEYPADLATDEPVDTLVLQKKDPAENMGKDDDVAEEEMERPDSIAIYTYKDGKALAGSIIRLSKFEGDFPNILYRKPTDTEGKYEYSHFDPNSKYEIRVENRGLKFEVDHYNFVTDKDGRVATIDGKPVKDEKDAVIEFKAFEKSSEVLPTTEVYFFVVDKETSAFVPNVELTANTITPNLSSYKNVKSDAKGMVTFKLEGQNGGKYYSVCVSKNGQFLWKFEPEQILISVDEDGEVKIENDVDPIFYVTKEDRRYLRDDLQKEINVARKYLAENHFSNAEARIKLEQAIQVSQEELDKPETIPFYVEGFIQSVKEAKKNLEQYLVKEEKKAEEEEKKVASSRGQVLGAERGKTPGEWTKDAKGWWFKKEDGSYPKNEWSYLSSGNLTGWFFFNEDGYMKTGWHFSNGKWYFLGTVSDETLGAMKTGWYLDPTSQYWYYLSPTDGAMLSGWQEINGKWYYLNEDASRPLGAMFLNEMTADGHRVDENGARVG